MTKQAHVLIVEDEVKLASILADYFTMSQYDTTCIHNGLEVEPWLALNNPDIIILDLMLPGKDGLAIAQAIRQTSDIPILMVTAKVEEVDRLLGLEIGADDYICKPFSPKEVVARVKAVLRRTRRNQLKKLPFELDSTKLSITIAPQSISLTLVEFNIMSLISSEPSRIFSREQIMNACYVDHRIVSDRTIDSHIKKLRKKITELINENWIQSVYGVGYKLVVD
jgi:two-component system response regulator BaeR